MTAAGWGAMAQPPKAQAAVVAGVAKIRRDALAVTPLLKTGLAREFVAGAARLPEIQTRTLYRDDAKKEWLSGAQGAALPEEARGALKAREIDETRYYNTNYGSPLAYARALEVLASSPGSPIADVAGKRIMDFGYGGIGHLRLLGGMGADVVGVDVDGFLKALYSEPGDVGPVKTLDGKRDGSITLVHGFFPAGEGVRAKVGTGFDLILSKNTLKMGYIHPSRPADPSRLVQLGVDDRTFVQTLYDMLKPGGGVLIYNLCPALSKPEEEYRPWTDGRCPFARDLLESVGFKVIAFDVVDDGPAREMGRALEWDVGGMNLEKDLFAHYTIFQKPAK
jgi:hypothetical protein